jgi:hypothetical protein
MANNVIQKLLIFIGVKNNTGPGVNSATASINKLTQSVKASNQAADAHGRAFVQIAGAYNALIVVERLRKYVTGAIAPAIQMQDAMTQMRVTTGLSTEAVDKLRKASLATAKVTPIDPIEAMNAAKDLQLALGDRKSVV